jgi:hypothetical protein
MSALLSKSGVGPGRPTRSRQSRCLDAGHTWNPAEVAPRTGHAWQKFTFTWTPAFAGEYVLACRATTSSGATQPLTPRRNRVYRRIIFVTQGNP